MKKHFFLTTLLAMQMVFVPLVAQNPIYLDDNQPLEARVQDALQRMTLEEKVRMSYAQGKFSSPGCPRLGIPELWMSDGPHGVRAEINWNDWKYANWTNDSCTAFPALTCLAATWNPEMAAKYGRAVGEEARYRKKDVLLGPGVNIYRTPLNGRNFEYMGEDPYLASVMCVPYIREVQKNGVAVCVKHYALNNQELWRGHIDVEVSDRALYEIYLPAFKAAVEKGGAWSIMGAYNKVRGTHATHNKLLNNEILKGEWKFDGCVITDWGAAHDTYEAAMYGLDIEMGSHTNGLTSESAYTYDDYYLGKAYLNMIKEGRIPMEVVNDKAARVLRLIFRTAMNRNKPYGSMATEEHYQVAREIGTEGIVLLKNEATKQHHALLPVLPGQYKKILVVGDNATRSLTVGGGSSELKVKEEISPLEALKATYGNSIEYAQGYMAGRPRYGKVDAVPQAKMTALREEAVKKAAEADLIIYIGGLNKNHEQDCEAGDRISYALPFQQNELIEALLSVNKNLVMVLISGNAVEMPWIKEVPSIVQSWYLGSMNGPALTDILSGAVNPSGKLPFSYPVKLSDCPAIAMGSHVSAARNHQTNKLIPLKFRFDVAMSGRLGMEMQPKDFTPDEYKFAAQAISTYKQIRPVVQFGDLYRLISPYAQKNISSLMYVTPDKEEAVLFVYQLKHRFNPSFPRLTLQGLSPEASYEICEINTADLKEQAKKTITGGFLIDQGMEVWLDKEYDSKIFHLKKTK